MTQKIRVLHAIGNLARGGVETWLVQVLRRLHGNPDIQMDFLVHNEEPGAYDDEVRGLGAKIHICSGHRSFFRYSKQLHRILMEHEYDVVHSHLQHWSGMVLRTAYRAGVPQRIAHSFLACQHLPGTHPARKLYYRFMQEMISKYATDGIGCSELAGASLFGDRWARDPRCRVLYSGIEPNLFEHASDRAALMAEFGIPEGATVIGHIGRFRKQKNHEYLLSIADDLLARDSEIHLVLLGDGPLESEIRQKAKLLQHRDRIHFAGSRNDIPRLLMGLFDACVLPSLFEGLPHVGLECQAAGVPLVLADTITKEVAMIPELVHWRSLADAPSVWSESLLDAIRSTRITKREAFERFLASDFNLDRATMNLLNLYRKPGDHARAARSA